MAPRCRGFPEKSVHQTDVAKKWRAEFEKLVSHKTKTSPPKSGLETGIEDYNYSAINFNRIHKKNFRSNMRLKFLADF